jgi:Xaa-Pro aminopeptidase
MVMRSIVSLVAALVVTSGIAHGQSGARYDLDQVQGLMAVQMVDGWLLTADGLDNPVAKYLAKPSSSSSHRWFFLIPIDGKPRALVHSDESGLFASVATTTYSSPGELRRLLKKFLAGVGTVAMELERVDDATIRFVRRSGATVQSSSPLVQFTKSLWGKDGRVAHYVAAHHLEALTKQATALIGGRLSAGKAVSEYDVVTFLESGYAIRGIAKGHISVAAGGNTAKPEYEPTVAGAVMIEPGMLIRISLSGYLMGPRKPIYASSTRMAYVGKEVPQRIDRAWAGVASARDSVVTLLRHGHKEGRPISGAEADAAARAAISTLNLGAGLTHSTGHSLDVDLMGDGTNLSAKDNGKLAIGSGFTVGPGLYFGDFGVRTEINVHLGAKGVELTSTPQTKIDLIGVASAR